jgi:transcription elongation factor GreA
MKTLLTENGRKKIQDELNYLLTVEKKRAIQEIADAKDRGGIEENSEFDIARDELNKLQQKISKLQDTLNNSSIIDGKNIDLSKVSILTTVTVKNKLNDKEFQFTIVPENEINVKLSKISPNSPIGSGLMNKKIGEVTTIVIPSGSIDFEIINISPYEG